MNIESRGKRQITGRKRTRTGAGTGAPGLALFETWALSYLPQLPPSQTQLQSFFTVDIRSPDVTNDHTEPRGETQVSKSARPRAPGELGTRRFVLQRFPFAVTYRERDSGVQILAFAHGHRRPGYWKERL